MGSKGHQRIFSKMRDKLRLKTFIQSVGAGHARDVRDGLTLSWPMPHGAIVFPAPVPNNHFVNKKLLII